MSECIYYLRKFMKTEGKYSSLIQKKKNKRYKLKISLPFFIFYKYKLNEVYYIIALCIRFKLYCISIIVVVDTN